MATKKITMGYFFKKQSDFKKQVRHIIENFIREATQLMFMHFTTSQCRATLPDYTKLMNKALAAIMRLQSELVEIETVNPLKMRIR